MLIKLKSGMTIAAGKASAPKYKTVGDRETPVCEFGIAAHKYKDEDGENHTVWVNCKAWRELANAAQDRIRKGDIVFVVGFTKERSWTGTDGAARTSEETTIDYFNVQQYGAPQAPRVGADDPLAELIGKPNVTVQPAGDPVSAAFADFEEEADGELPF